MNNNTQMERIIIKLMELREKAERSFIDNSLIKIQTRLNRPMPDTQSDIELIAELNHAISILENAMATKESSNL